MIFADIAIRGALLLVNRSATFNRVYIPRTLSSLFIHSLATTNLPTFPRRNSLPLSSHVEIFPHSKIIPRQFQTCLSQIPQSLQQNYSKTISKSSLTENPALQSQPTCSRFLIK